MLSRLLPLLAFIMTLVALAVGLQINPTKVPSPLIGQPAPAFALPRLDDPEQKVAARDLIGQVWLLNIWASWCKQCLLEHPIIAALNQDLVPIVGLNYKDQPADAKAWLARAGNPYRFSLVDRDGAVGLDWGVYGVPETFVIDRAGIIRHKHIGPLSEADLHETIRPLLGSLAAEPR